MSDQTIMDNAQELAQQVLATYQSQFVADCLPIEAFMVHRPASLAESYQHGLDVAKILNQWHLAPSIQAAGLLHSFVCKEVLSPQQVAEVCGPRAAFLCRTYQEILQQPTSSRGKSHFIKRIKLYIAAYCDLDLAFLSVASLWDHFIMAKQSTPTIKRIFVEEAQAVMIPLLDILGLWHLKTDVEEQVMQWGQNQQDYQYLIKRLTQAEELRNQAFSQVKQKLSPKLTNTKISCKLQTPAQIYNPLLPEKAHPEAFQKLIIDILVDTEEACYTALRWIHHLWQPVEKSLIDHIGISKLNGDRYLVTTVIIPMGNTHTRAQFNIRSYEMEQINQWGLVALQMPECAQTQLPNAWWHNQAQEYAHICSAKMGDLPETLYVFSPQGELFRFHRGCTVVDYAYHVHSEVAHQCKRFRINGDVVGPTTILHHLDLVELEHDPQFSGPNHSWLSAARTDRAKGHINRFLKRRERGHAQGRTVLDKKHKELAQHYRIDIPNHRIDQALHQASRYHEFERLEDLLAEIAAGRVDTGSILTPLFSDEVVRQVDLPPPMRLLPHQLSLAQCCKPRPGDDIVGRAKKKGDTVIRLKIHRHNCKKITHLKGAVPLKWRLQPQLNTVARLEIAALAEEKLLYDALDIFKPGLPQLTLHKVEAEAHNGIARLNFTIEAKDQKLIDDITHKLKNLPSHHINEVRQMHLLFSEREELVKPIDPAGFNPYRRQPVKDREMLFGRSQELAHTYNMLQTGVGILFVQGQKRVGKTSLLLHLKKYYLGRRSVLPVFIDFQLLSNFNGPSFYYEIANTIYNDLQSNTRISQIAPPLWELFEGSPTTQLVSYLKNIQIHLGFNKLVLLIDEFSRTIDDYQQETLTKSFFDQWRGLIQATVPTVSYVMVVQQQSFKHLREQPNQALITPIWHLLELGETILVEPLQEKDAHQLIERPTYNHLDYSPDALRYVWRLTGGSPFLIQAFCFNLVRYMAHHDRRQVEWADVDTVQTEFRHPNESLFAHILDVIYDIPSASPTCRQLANYLNSAEHPVTLIALERDLFYLTEGRLHTALQKLTDQHILTEPEPGTWQFSSLLFGRWLAVNRILEHHASY